MDNAMYRQKYFRLKLAYNMLKERIKTELENSRAYHKDQMEHDCQPQVIKHHHEIVIDYIDTELTERLLKK